MIKGLILVTRGLLRSTEIRRWAMFVVVLAALLMVFLGATFLEGALMSRPAFFVTYWLICAGLTLLSILLAAYDLLLMRAAERALRAKLRKERRGREEEPPEC